MAPRTATPLPPLTPTPTSASTQGTESGGGAPRVPQSQNPPTDRDASYVEAQPGTVPPPAAAPSAPLRPGGPSTSAPVPIPVANTPEARRHLLRRAGLDVGAAAEARIADVGLETWLGRQLDPAVVDDAEATIRAWWPEAFLDIDQSRATLADYNDQAGLRAVEQSTFARRLFGSRQIFEQVVDVFANHLNVPPVHGDDLAWNAADYHLKVIRGNAFGSCAQMLHDAARHPSMTVILDNKDSMAADVNENYGRELLELHTVGVGHYNEDDVRASSVIMSGRRITDQVFSWEPQHHAVGPVRVMDFADANATAAAGLDLGDRYIDYLAHHPATARTVARKLAVRFVSDKPGDALLDTPTAAYLDNDTSILAVLKTIFRSDDFWAPTATKLRRPTDDLSGVVRCMGMTIDRAAKEQIWHLYWALDALGDAPLRWGPPNGYPDVAAAWLGAGQMAGRWDHHRELLNGHRVSSTPSAAFSDAITPTLGIAVQSWADAVSTTVLGAACDERDLAAVCSLLGLAADAPVAKKHADQKLNVAALFFDSPRYLLR